MGFVTTVDSGVSVLADQRMQGLRSKLRAANKVAHWLNRLLGWFEGVLIASLNKANQAFISQSIWFRGAAQEILRKDDSKPIENLEQVLLKQYTDIENLKEQVRRMRNECIDLRDNNEPGPKLQMAIARVLDSSENFYEALESYRWSLMEVEASRAKIFEGYSATSAAELDAVFDRIASEK